MILTQVPNEKTIASKFFTRIMIDIQQFDINEPIPSKFAKPKNYLRLLIYTRSNPCIGHNGLLRLADILLIFFDHGFSGNDHWLYNLADYPTVHKVNTQYPCCLC